MKLRALSCNKTLLRKDIFRFAPLWAIYLIGGLLVMLTSLSGSEGIQVAYNLSVTMGPFAIINMIYAVLAAQLLFGDLFNSRLCNALHALPMRRETWFCTHMIAGLLYSVVPHLVAAVFFMSMLGQFGWVALTWVAVMLMEYLFFFGVAVLCVFCTGSRFAMAAVYAILNFFSIIVYWFVTVIYQPLLYGVEVSEDIFTLTCPVINMAGNTRLLRFDWLYNAEYSSSSALHPYTEATWVYNGPGAGWGYLGICAGIGVALMAVALLLYRRRKLECAGEFVAIEALKPVLGVIFALCAGGVVAAFGQGTGLTDGYLGFFVVGLVVGWFGGQMLLRRTVRVFQGKSFLRLAILGVALALTVGLTAWDPVGITRYIPENGQIQSAELTQGSFYGYTNSEIDAYTAESVEQIRMIHQQILQERDRYTGRLRHFSIRYTLKSGRQITRTYKVYANGNAWKQIEALYNGQTGLLGETDWDEWYKAKRLVWFNGEKLEQYAMEYNSQHPELSIPISAYQMEYDLLRAVWEDAKAGTLKSSQFADKDYTYWVSVESEGNSGSFTWRDLYITDSAENCQKWIKQYAEVLEVLGVM